MHLPLSVKKHGVILEPRGRGFEAKAVLNPACYQEGETIHLLYRAVDRHGKSSIGYARLIGPQKVVERWEKPLIDRRYRYESDGVEDPRIVKIGDTLYLTYVATDGRNALSAYASGKDIFHLRKRGIISPRFTYHTAVKIFEKSYPKARLKDAYFFFASFYEEENGKNVLVWHKDFILFPKKIRGKFVALQRILPDIQVLSFRSFQELKQRAFWRKNFANISRHVVLENKHWFESRNIGGGCPPIWTPDGWVVIYHGVEALNKKRVYHASAALLDKDNPTKVIGKLHEPLFSPVKRWEKRGMVSNVVFPTGTALFGDRLYIYYGAADKRIAVASVSLRALVQEMKHPTHGHYA
ncbi:pesticidal protein Cry7Aa [Candidatus Parcubacteria bacterium]|nr:MAG: pesticidal protein Cry7Aa [Candidatus Parcubacteria bacterium]